MAPRSNVPASPMATVKGGGVPADSWLSAQMKQWAPAPETAVTRSYQSAASFRPSVGADNLAYAHLKKTNAVVNNVSKSPSKPLAWKPKPEVKISPYSVVDEHAIGLGKPIIQSVCGLKDEKPGPQAAGKPHLAGDMVMLEHHKLTASGLLDYRGDKKLAAYQVGNKNGGDSFVQGFYTGEEVPKPSVVAGVSRGLTGGTGGIDIRTAFYTENKEVFSKAATPFGVGAGPSHAGLEDFTAAKQLDFQKEASASMPEAMAARQLAVDNTPAKPRTPQKNTDSFFAAHAAKQQSQLSGRATAFSLDLLP